MGFDAPTRSGLLQSEGSRRSRELMHIVDTHTHASPHWFEPVETLLHAMDVNGVAQALLVQFRGNFHNEYLFDCVRRFPQRLAACVALDVTAPDAPVVLESLVRKGAKGVRFWIHREGDVAPDSLWQKANDLCLPLSVIGTEEEFGSDEFRRLVAAFPGTRVVIEHFGRAGRDELPPYTRFRRVLALAEFPNVFMKLGGLGEICHRPSRFPASNPFPLVPPFAKMAIEAFGPRRLMFASDFPPVTYREGYRNALNGLRDHLSFLSADDQAWIFGGTALSTWNITPGNQP